MHRRRAYPVVGAVLEGRVAAPLDALGRRQPAGALRLEEEDRLVEGVRVVERRGVARTGDQAEDCDQVSGHAGFGGSHVWMCVGASLRTPR